MFLFFFYVCWPYLSGQNLDIASDKKQEKNEKDDSGFLEAVLKWFPNFIMRIIRDIFRLRKRERSSSYVTDDEDENVRKGRVRKERNRFKTVS